MEDAQEEYLKDATFLGVATEAPELDSRTSFWLQAFNLLNRTRPSSMGGIAPISPCAIFELADRLKWPCTDNEALKVIIGLDDQYREMNQPQRD